MKMLGTETDDKGRTQIYVYLNKNNYVFGFHDEHTYYLWSWHMVYDSQPHLSLEFSSVSF